jgi:protease PrsW
MNSSFARASHGSPLRRPWLGCGITVALVLIVLVGALLAATIFIQDTPEALRVLLRALALTSALSLIPFFGLRWLDRREPEPIWLSFLAFVWGGLIATGYSLIFNELNTAIFGELLAIIIGAPVVEELAKGFGVLVIFLLLRSEFDNARDGLIYGGLVGAGFNWLEAALYVATGFARDGIAPFADQLTTRFILLGFNGHLLFSAMVGLGLGISRQTRNPSWKVIAPLLGIIAAIVAHALWNSVGAFTVGIGAEVIGSDSAAVDVMLSLFATGITAWPFFLAAFIALRRNDRWEHRVMIEQLADEIGGAVTPDEYASIVQHDRPTPGDRRAGTVYSAQAELAIRKWHVLADGHDPATDPITAAWRADIDRLRGA